MRRSPYSPGLVGLAGVALVLLGAHVPASARAQAAARPSQPKETFTPQGEFAIGLVGTTSRRNAAGALSLVGDIKMSPALSLRLGVAGVSDALGEPPLATFGAGYDGENLAFRLQLLISRSEGLLPVPGLALRVGPKRLHVVVRALDPGLVPGPMELVFVGVRGDLGRVTISTGYARTVVDSSQLHVATAVRLGRVRVGALLGVGPGSRAKHITATGGLSVTVPFGPEETLETGATAAPARPVRALRPQAVAWPRTDNVLAPGRTFLQKLGTLRGAPSTRPPARLSLCIVDEHKVIEGIPFAHISCDTDLPATSPTAWRTGCYVTLPSGVWRLARCPSQDSSPPAPPSLIVPSGRPPTSARFAVWHSGSRVRRRFTLKRGVVSAVCQHFDFDAPEVRCVATGLGLVWSARYWPVEAGAPKPNAPPRPAEPAVLTLAVSEGPTSAPVHLQVDSTTSAACYLSANCAAHGHCTLRGGTCVAASAKGCRDSMTCRRHGKCDPLGGMCVATNDVDCAASTGCDRHGRCVHRLRRCVRPPKPSAVPLSGSATPVTASPPAAR